MTSSEIFGSNVFDLRKMKKKLPKSTFHALQNAIEKGADLPISDADAIAQSIMEWALSKGATHYTHWFQPMTGLTAQKHDAFFSLDSQSLPLERFSGSQLIQSEPDASSFPSGGMRTTFEARGYTAWDPSSPVFIMHNGDVPVLCIPSVFFSYTGHTLDKKTPLLRSVNTLNDMASEAVKLMGGGVHRIDATVGVEQEYFLVDRDFYDKRPDLIMAGRTLLGCRPAKGQQMEDHYFGTIKDRVLAFMQDVETRLYKLGIPSKTRHNEVAPHQYETAPIFEPANLAADHNQLTMEVLRKTAREHGLAALLHEKPFADVNGSGKHLNWSMALANNGSNLLEPGKEPHHNLAFLYFMVAVVNAVHKRGGVLRSTIASPGNDHRLGANEAPPAIMSVFLGQHMNRVLDTIESAEEYTEDTVAEIDLGLAELPNIDVDTTDRNRTSPFAFTGNKFEFRAVGSSQSISLCIAMLNAAVAESLEEMNAELAKLDDRSETAIYKMLRPFVKRSKPVRFEGNNYSAEWEAEAAKRGLPNNKTTPEAFSVWSDQEVRDFVSKRKVLSESEMDAHTSIKLEHYNKTMDIEASLLLRLVNNFVLPAGFRYQAEVSKSIRSLQEAAAADPGGKMKSALSRQLLYLERLSTNISELLNSRDALDTAHEGVLAVEDEMEQALGFAKKIFPMMEEVRALCDEMESCIDKDLWKLPSYQELLFLL